MSITREQTERLNLKDELAPLRRLRDAKLGRRNLEIEQARLYNEELTTIAEAIDSHYLESTFIYDFDGRQAVLPDGTALSEMYETGVETVEAMARTWPVYGLELSRRRAEAANQKLIDAMLRGELEANTVIELSPYPDEAEPSCQASVLEDMGYKPDLRRGMIRIVQRLEDGRMSLTTCSLDNSSLSLFQTLQAELGQPIGATTTDILGSPTVLQTHDNPKQIAKYLIDCYDRRLSQMNNGQAFLRGSLRGRQNSMDALEDSSPVLRFYFDQLETLGGDWAQETLSPKLADTISQVLTAPNLPQRMRIELSSALDSGRLNETSVGIVKRALELSVWATIVQQLENPQQYAPDTNFSQMLENAQQAEAVGRRMVGCGGSTELFGSSRSQAISQVFESLLRIEARYSFNRKMYCVVCQRPPRRNKSTRKMEAKKWCGPCGICQGCDKKLRTKINSKLAKNNPIPNR